MAGVQAITGKAFRGGMPRVAQSSPRDPEPTQQATPPTTTPKSLLVLTDTQLAERSQALLVARHTGGLYKDPLTGQRQYVLPTLRGGGCGNLNKQAREIVPLDLALARQKGTQASRSQTSAQKLQEQQKSLYLRETNG